MSALGPQNWLIVGQYAEVRQTLESLARSGREYFKTTGARLADIDKVGHQVRQVAPEETTSDLSADPICLVCSVGNLLSVQ